MTVGAPRRVRLAASVLVAVVALCLVGPWLLPDPLAIDPANTYAPPSLDHLAGTDDLGRDVLARLLVGGRVSLLVAVLAALASTTIGGAVGVTAGFLGGRFDRIVLRVIEGMIAIPKLPLLLILSAIDVGRVASGAGGDVLRLVLVIAMFGWMTTARLARAEAKKLASAGWVTASRLLGASNRHVLRRHVLPGALPTIVVAATLDLGEFVVYESVLSFLGLGVRPPSPSWGAMLEHGLTYTRTAPHLFVLPGLLTMLTIGALLTLGEALSDRLDPRRQM